MIVYTCPACGAAYKCQSSLAGSKIPCRLCGQRLQIPGPLQPTTTPNKTVLAQVRKPDLAAEPEMPKRSLGSRFMRRVKRMVWMPRRMNPPENSVDTLLRVVVNLFVVKMIAIAVLIAVMGCLVFVTNLFH